MFVVASLYGLLLALVVTISFWMLSAKKSTLSSKFSGLCASCIEGEGSVITLITKLLKESRGNVLDTWLPMSFL